MAGFIDNLRQQNMQQQKANAFDQMQQQARDQGIRQLGRQEGLAERFRPQARPQQGMSMQEMLRAGLITPEQAAEANSYGEAFPQRGMR